MPIYRVIRRTDSQQVYEYQADVPIEWHGMEFADHEHVEYIAPVINNDGSIEGVAVPVNRRLTKLAFVGRLGADFATILAAAKTNVQVELFVKMLDWATPDADGTSVDLDDQRVIDALTTLEQAGLIGVGRAAEILE